MNKNKSYEKLRSRFIQADADYIEGRVDVFRQKISVDKPQKAVLTITALGVYEARINGEKAGDIFLAPGYTYYPRNLHVQEYELTLREGENELVVYLGQGWYCGRFTFDNKTQIYGENPAVAWLLETEDGKVAKSTPEDVELLESPYEYAGLYDGEVYYADGKPGELGAESTQEKHFKVISYTGKLPEVFEESPCALRLREEMPVVAAYPQGDVTILDFGQNFAGVISIDPSKLQGESLKLRHGEILNPDGSLYTANLRKAKAEITYHKGESKGIYTPKFTYMGFRYVELSGAPYTEGLITAHALYSDMEPTGEFHCENENVDKLYRNQKWGQKSNYVEVPTDCPQRDERMGYTGDGHTFARTGSYNFDTRAFWKKFFKDIRYSQMDNSEGYIPSTVPALGPAGIGFLNMLGWGNAITLIPEALYEQYGEESFYTDNYESMKKFADCECRKLKPLNLWIAPNLGDWLTLGKDVAYMAMHNGPVSNAFIVHDLEFLSSLAAKLGHEADALRYEKQLEKTRKAYIRTFVKKNGTMTDDYQGAYIMALKFVLPKGELWDKVFATLVKKIKTEGMQTGFFATQHILPLLCDNGESKLAYDLLLQPNCPGWMYQVNCGATTTWERWDALRPDGTVNETKMSDDNMVSFNHYSFGSVGEFYYRYILGIKPLLPGYEELQLAPFVEERLGAAEGSYKSVAGEIKVAWTWKPEKKELHITTPRKAQVLLPDGNQVTVEAGSYSWSFS